MEIVKNFLKLEKQFQKLNMYIYSEEEKKDINRKLFNSFLKKYWLNHNDFIDLLSKKHAEISINIDKWIKIRSSDNDILIVYWLINHYNLV